VFTDKGKAYPVGTELNVELNTHHGSHTTKLGATFLAMLTGNVNLTNFRLSKEVE